MRWWHGWVRNQRQTKLLADQRSDELPIMPTLLVIDDEQSVRYSFRRVFEGDKGQVLTAGTAAEGLALLREHRPDVIVLDLQLPDGNGLDVFREIHALDAKRPVVFIT